MRDLPLVRDIHLDLGPLADVEQRPRSAGESDLAGIPPPVCIAGHDSAWWGLQNPQAPFVCARCHPPLVAEEQVEWWRMDQP